MEDFNPVFAACSSNSSLQPSTQESTHKPWSINFNVSINFILYRPLFAHAANRTHVHCSIADFGSYRLAYELGV